MSDQGRTIRVPIHMLESRSKLGRIAARLEQDLGREPLDKELATEVDMDVNRVHEIRRSTQETISFETQTGVDGDGRLGDLIPDEMAVNPHDAATTALLTQHVGQVLHGLPERERRVLALRFGLAGADEHRLQGVADMLQVSRERVRQIENRALRKLRLAPAARNLRENANA